MSQLPTRRAFFAGVAALAVGAVCGVGVRPFAPPADVLRPPGALAEADFAARCIRCGRCISACPQDVLYPLGIEQDALSVRTPSLDFTQGKCTFCDKCRKVCPTSAVGAVDPYAPQLGRIGVAVVHEERCLAYIQPGSCGICEKACEYSAISFDSERRIVVDHDKCNGCGACVAVCPSNVNTHFEGGQTRGVEVVTESSIREGGRA